MLKPIATQPRSDETFSAVSDASSEAVPQRETNWNATGNRWFVIRVEWRIESDVQS